MLFLDLDGQSAAIPKKSQFDENFTGHRQRMLGCCKRIDCHKKKNSKSEAELLLKDFLGFRKIFKDFIRSKLGHCSSHCHKNIKKLISDHRQQKTFLFFNDVTKRSSTRKISFSIKVNVHRTKNQQLFNRQFSTLPNSV